MSNIISNSLSCTSRFMFIFALILMLGCAEKDKSAGGNTSEVGNPVAKVIDSDGNPVSGAKAFLLAMDDFKEAPTSSENDAILSFTTGEDGIIYLTLPDSSSYALYVTWTDDQASIQSSTLLLDSDEETNSSELTSVTLKETFSDTIPLFGAGLDSTVSAKVLGLPIQAKIEDKQLLLSDIPEGLTQVLFYSTNNHLALSRRFLVGDGEAMDSLEVSFGKTVLDDFNNPSIYHNLWYFSKRPIWLSIVDTGEPSILKPGFNSLEEVEPQYFPNAYEGSALRLHYQGNSGEDQANFLLLGGSRWDLSKIDSITFWYKSNNEISFFLGTGKNDPAVIIHTFPATGPMYVQASLTSEDIGYFAVLNAIHWDDLMETQTSLGLLFKGAAFHEVYLDEMILHGPTLDELFPE